MQKATAQLSLFPAPDIVPEQAAFEIRKSSRARRLSVKVYPRGRVEVVVPKRATRRDVESFLKANRDWIDNARRHFAVEFAPDTGALPDRIDLPAIGASFVLRWRRHEAEQPVRVRQAGNTLVLSGATRDLEESRKALQRWLSRTAKAHFSSRLNELSTLTGLGYQRMQVRAQKTCWGSHSSSGTISLNVCALFLGPELLRYLMLHELCHGRHMNHSRRFWNLLERHEPGSKKLDRRLSESWRDIPAWVGIY